MTESEEQQTWPDMAKDLLTRGRRAFLTRTATDDAEQLLRRSSLPTISQSYQADNVHSYGTTATSTAHGSLSQNLGAAGDHAQQQPSTEDDVGFRQRRKASQPPLSTTDKATKRPVTKGEPIVQAVSRSGKLGTFSGVFVPTSLNVFSILMFLRYGFVLGQSGLLAMLAMIITAYSINVFTVLSISAVASNGTVRGGGAYYLISRSLGPEFGGSIGIVSYLGFVFNTGMNSAGLVECLIYNFGSKTGVWYNWLPEGDWWEYLWASVVILVCVCLCLAGSAIFARASNGLLLILIMAIFSIPLSSLIRSPFKHTHGPRLTEFTGWSVDTIRQNLFPNLTRGAAGSQIRGRESFRDLFGILYPSTGGIFAGASLSGSLRNPSKSIPRGTIFGISLTFISYTLITLSLAATITRKSLYSNVNIVQDVNVSEVLILLGEIAASFFSALMGIIGPASQLQAIARDGIFPGLKIFGRGSQKTDEPVLAIFLTWVIAQFTILFDINRIASLVTMTYLMMSLSLHLACLLLKLSSAPNFRPSFQYFNQWTALVGATMSFATMFFVDETAAAGCIIILSFIFLLIHYTTPPKSWGSDVTSGLVYHQVRKYLLRLKTEHVKYWRPQILLFVNDPRRGQKLIQFSNSLKKGGLFILGHVIVTENFGASVPEARRQQLAWTRYIEYMKIKSFVNIAISPSIEWGARNIVLSAGLGGMRPNIVMMGFYNLQQFRKEQPLIDMPSPPPTGKTRFHRKSTGETKVALPTDICHTEQRTDIQSYMLVLEDMILKVQTNVAVAVGFDDLELPNLQKGNTRKYIDLWPIQMSAEVSSDGNNSSQNVLTTNFDTYTLILQLGCILNTVPAWKKSFTLRVAVFVEYESDVEEERSRVKGLLDSLRIKAEVLVYWLASGGIKSYQVIVNGEEVDTESEERIDKILEDEDWWMELRQLRGKIKSGDINAEDVWSVAKDQRQRSGDPVHRRRGSSVVHSDGLRRILQDVRHRPSFSRLSRLGVSFNIRTHRLDDELLSRHASHPSGSEYSDTDLDDEASDGVDDSRLVNNISTQDVFGHDEQSDNKQGEAETIKPDSKFPSSNKGSRASSRKSKMSKKKRKSRPPSLLDVEASSAKLAPGTSIEYDADVDSTADRGRRPRREFDNEEPRDDGTASDQKLELPEGSKRSRAPSPNFTSTPVPPTRFASEEGQGPSIMFADAPHPRRQTVTDRIDDQSTRSIYQRSVDGSKERTSKPAQGFPSAASVPLSFNDIPSRAQHLILNELMSQNSDEAAVIFTTLPAPEENTYKHESASLTYLTDLEVLTQGLGPVLLVHSNSMTVTTNL